MVHQPYGIMLFVNRKEWLSVIDPTIFLEVAGFLRAEDRRCIVRDGAFDARMLSSTRPTRGAVRFPPGRVHETVSVSLLKSMFFIASIAMS
jgi:hypothetical protein